MSAAPTPYQALLLLSFGGPEGPDDVMPFLRNVTRGRGVPDERLATVAEHYNARGGISPINAQCRDLIAALRTSLDAAGIDLPIYWGNRNWHPMVGDTVDQMAADGITHALALVTSAYSSYSSCRQYHEDIERARNQTGPSAPVIDKVTQFYDLEGFRQANITAVADALELVPEHSHVAFTAHSVPLSMAQTSRYQEQLLETADAVARANGVDDWELVYQSRSGPPQVPWLEPDICDHIDALADRGAPGVVVAPIGFISDHMEVIHDLDTEAAQAAAARDLPFARARTAGTDEGFVDGLVSMIAERVEVGHVENGLRGGVCELDCCPAPQRPTQPAR